jgi:acid phosphatase family membrane protein YuiD
VKIFVEQRQDGVNVSVVLEKGAAPPPASAIVSALAEAIKVVANPPKVQVASQIPEVNRG